MDKKQIINQFTKALVAEEDRKNKVTQIGITSTLITAAVNLAFVNESCKSSGKVSKSQVIYRKITDKSCDDVKASFQEVNIKFLKMLKILSRNRKLIVSFDTTKEAFTANCQMPKMKIRFIFIREHSERIILLL